MQEILRTSSVSFRSFLRYPDISIETGKATFLIGASGSGKSTLLKLFNGTQSPDSGEVYYRGKAIASLDTVELRREVLLVGQSVYLFPGTIQDNFRSYYAYREADPPPESRILQYLSLCCAEFPLDADCESMSGGERQRIYLAIALSLHPRILMLDEPTSALDEQTAGALLSNIKRFCIEEGITLIVISHDAKLTNRFADQVIHLKRTVI